MNAPVRYKVGLMAKVFPTVRTWEDFFASTISGRSNGAGEFDGISGDRQNACRAKDDLDILGDTVFLRRHQCNVIMFCFTVWRWSKAHFQDVLIFVSICGKTKNNIKYKVKTRNCIMVLVSASFDAQFWPTLPDTRLP